ncbi:MAG: hypothetical protein BWY09_02870 [Candidatus Hydrogenedentes bacterium ADurb.Bin179]|nr:MAG: hypothetical protein BWY09_02870 [Candidatus Hydrogenedentes bacterium ADurb.Bin179]
MGNVNPGNNMQANVIRESPKCAVGISCIFSPPRLETFFFRSNTQIANIFFARGNNSVHAPNISILDEVVILCSFQCEVKKGPLPVKTCREVEKRAFKLEHLIIERSFILEYFPHPAMRGIHFCIKVAQPGMNYVRRGTGIIEAMLHCHKNNTANGFGNQGINDQTAVSHYLMEL